MSDALYWHGHLVGEMGVSGDEGGPLLGSLSGKTATFMVDGRDANVLFARTLVGSIAREGRSSTVLDLDALYSSHADLIFGGLTDGSGSLMVKVPAPGADIEAEFASLFSSNQQVIVIDSLNSFYHLVSMEDGRSRGRRVMFALASLSCFAKANGSAVVFSMYRREGFAKSGRGRSIASLSDVTASVGIRNGGIEIRTENGSVWPGGVYFSRIP